MNNFSLKSHFPLNKYKAQFDEILIRELIENFIFSFSIPDKNLKNSNVKINKIYKVKLPKVGMCSFLSNKNSFIMGLQPNQYFLFIDKNHKQEINFFKDNFSNLGYFTDQSDSWVILNLLGKNTRICLERICPINLDEDKFLIGQVARTSMEHIGTIIIRTKQNEFILLSPRSSANSFIHAVETSIKNTL